ncbi:MAG: CinA family nicotinamide mononucleotide deamidase-related protein, partial [Nitrospiraceae bacterium]
MRQAEIIAIGSELLLGGRLDTNSLFLTERLAALGIEVRFKSIVGDDESDIASALRTAAARADVVVLTGGLGPTQDDWTRQAVARVTGRPLRRRAEALEGMRRRFAAWGRVPSPAQFRQSLIPSGADVLSNPIGSAPGFSLRWKNCLLAALPGVPREAEDMFAVSLAPRLAAERMTNQERPWIERRVLQTFGLIESEVDQRLQGVVRPGGPVRVGLLASPLGVSVSLTACLDTAARSSRFEPRLFDRVTAEVRARLGACVYAEGNETMEIVVGRYLTQQGHTLALAESCTGGLIGHRITQVSGSSSYLDRGVVCYSNESKEELLSVPRAVLQQY